MDHHVPAAITRGLRQHGIDVLTAAEDGAATLDDEQLLERATRLGRRLFSEDTDLWAVAAHWLQTGRAFAGLVFGAQTSLTIGQAICDLELIARVFDPPDMLNRIERIPYS
jgi:hypothetical protein